MSLMMTKAKTHRFSQIAIVIMIIIFIMNLILSRDYNLLRLVLSGGGEIVNYLGESYTTVFEYFQVYRLITYGYTQTAIWHLLANVLGLWYVGIYLEKRIGIMQFIIVYHLGLVIAGTAIFAFYPGSVNYGASPAIFACLGVLTNWLIRKRDLWNEYKSQKGFYYLLCYMVLSNFLGVSTFVIHLLGFCTGFFLGFVVKHFNAIIIDCTKE